MSDRPERSRAPAPKSIQQERALHSFYFYLLWLYPMTIQASWIHVSVGTEISPWTPKTTLILLPGDIKATTAPSYHCTKEYIQFTSLYRSSSQEDFVSRHNQMYEIIFKSVTLPATGIFLTANSCFVHFYLFNFLSFPPTLFLTDFLIFEN